jgi:CRISPR-associated protein Csm4
MQTLKFVLRPQTAFGTPLAGDTLFGHLCWALRWRHGESELDRLLDGYTEGRPYAVMSDAFPSGMLPRPTVPAARLSLATDPQQRKADKRRVWLPASQAGLPLDRWLSHAIEPVVDQRVRLDVRTQNTIHRLTGTTGTGPFAPRQADRLVHAEGSRLDLYVVFDPERLSQDHLQQALEDIGASGYGRDASTGLGKFSVDQGPEPVRWPTAADAAHLITLAPCAPCPEELVADDCHFQPLTRFGRHGSLHALGGQPFKRPVLLLRTGALLGLRSRDGTAVPLHGRGLGGVAQPLSTALPATVHQGYAPVVPVSVPALTHHAEVLG